MQASNGLIITAITVSAIVLFICGLFMMGSVKNAMPEVPEIVIPAIPTAAEIATLVNIPTTEVDNTKTDQVWELIFGSCEDDIIEVAESDVKDEVSESDLKEYIEDNIANVDKLTIKIVGLDDDKTETEVKELGYCEVGTVEMGDDEDDKSAVVTLVYDFTYEDKDSDDIHKDTITVTGTVDYDEGEFNDSDVELVYSL